MIGFFLFLECRRKSDGADESSQTRLIGKKEVMECIELIGRMESSLLGRSNGEEL